MIRVAVIGAGRWGPNLIRNFHEGRAHTVAWVVDRDWARLREVGDRFPNIALGEDADVAISDPRVDAVVVATPTSTHYELARAALLRGKHVLVEKPLATSSRQSEDLCELAEATGRVLMVGHVFLFNAAVQWVARYLARGVMGRAYYLSMVRTNLGPIRTDVNAAWDLAAHDISIANHWLGAEPLSASALGGTWINDGVEDAVFATLVYPGNVLVNLDVSWLNPTKSRLITVVGEHQMLTVDDVSVSEPVRIYDKGVADEWQSPTYVDSFASFRASIRDGDITVPKVSTNEPLKAQCEHFIRCIEDGVEPTSGGREGLAVVRALEAISASMLHHGAAVPVGAAAGVA